MKDRNETLLVGTIFGEPRFSQTKTGGTCAQFTVSVKRPDPSRVTDLINVTAWDSLADRLALEFGPDRRILVRGRIQKSSFLTQEGTRKTFIKISAEALEHPDEIVNSSTQEQMAGDYGYAA